MCKGVSKGEGLRFAAATMGVPLADTVAIGDSDNDLTMMRGGRHRHATDGQRGASAPKDAGRLGRRCGGRERLAHAFERLGVV